MRFVLIFVVVCFFVGYCYSLCVRGCWLFVVGCGVRFVLWLAVGCGFFLMYCLLFDVCFWLCVLRCLLLTVSFCFVCCLLFCIW